VAKDNTFPYLIPYVQDTAKALPMTPFGRVEEFYDFTRDPLVDPEQNKDSAKISVKLNKPKEPKIVKEKVIKNLKIASGELPTEDDLQIISEETSEIREDSSDAPNLVIIPHFNFLNDKIFEGFSLQYILEDAFKEVEHQTLEDDKFNTVSIFYEHELQQENTVPLRKISENHDGLFFAFLAVLSILSIANTVYNKKFQKYLSAFFNVRINFQVLREERSVNSQLYFLLLIASLFLSAAYIYQFITYFNLERIIPTFSEQHLFIKILTMVLSLLMLKFLFIKITGAVFQQLRLASDYIFTMIMFFNILTLILLPISISIQYLTFVPEEFFFYLALSVAAVIQVLLIFRVYQIGNSEPGTSVYYIFLYLCTLEILPLVVLIKLFVNIV
jgi:hypothetical protein